jgi:hypothetical protein
MGENSKTKLLCTRKKIINLKLHACSLVSDEFQLVIILEIILISL